MGPHRRGPALLLAGGVAVISSAAILIRLCQAPSLAIAAYRLGIAATLLVGYDLARHRRLPPARSWPWFASAGLFLAVHFAAWIASLRYTTVASSVVLVTTNPLFVALFAWLLGEPPDRRTLVGIVLGLGGAVLIGWGDFAGGPAPLLGDGLALIGALAMSAYLTVGRRARAGLGARTYSTWVYAVAAVLLAAAVGITGTSVGPYPPPTYGWLLLLALGPQILGHTAINAALAHLTAPAVALAILGEPVGSTLLAYLVLGEVPSVSTVAGGALILGGIALGLGGAGKRVTGRSRSP
ncbi:MAG: DMT family transporter [Deltaproteobacteria bacterium]|nr:DMT family transporter [Deltaproteobacteria bacterium]